MAVLNFKPIGYTGLRRTATSIYEEFLPQLQWPTAGRVYREMSDNDPVIGAVLYLAEMLIRGTSWKVQPASSSTQDVELADFVQSCFDDMEVSFANTLSEILSMLSYGFCVNEIVYKIRRGPTEASKKYKSKYKDGKVGWRMFPIRAQTSLMEWEFDEEGNAKTFVQCAEPTFERILIPMSKCLLFRTKVSKNNPEGRSLLRNAYRPWFFKKHFEEIEGIGIERDLAGFPVLTAPQDMDLWDPDDELMVKLRGQAEELVASIRRDSEEGLVLPFGWDIKLLASTSGRQVNIGETIDRYDNRIAVTLLSDLILLGSKSGSFALADTKQSMLAAALQAQTENIAEVFNSKAIPDLLLLNGYTGITELPKLVPSRIQIPSVKEIALLLRAMGLKIAGDKPLINYLRGTINAPELDEETFNSVYESQAPSKDDEGSEQDTDDDLDDDLDDTTDKTFEQNDLNYTGQ